MKIIHISDLHHASNWRNSSSKHRPISDLVDKKLSDEMLMMASWHGGMSIAYSQVGVVHALSYGLSYVLGTKHGIGNCIVFDQLDDFYKDDLKIFREMKAKHGIELPKNICLDLNDEEINTMIDVSLGLEPLWENALGPNWKRKVTRADLYQLYRRM